MAFSDQIQSLVGSVTEGEIDQWMADGAKELINIFPPKLKIKCNTFTLLNADSGTTLDLDAIGEVTHVTRENADSGYYTPCRKIPSAYGDLSNDSGNIMWYASATDPVFWIESNSSNESTLYVKPTPTNLQPAKAYHIVYPSVDASAVSTIANFPDEAEYLVVLYAAIKVLHNKMNEYSVSDLTITATPPVLPSLTSNSISFSTTAPTYTPQVVSPDFSDANTWLNTEEDSEMVASRMSVIQGQLQDYQAKIQNELNIFNKENTEYQAQLQKAIQDAQLASADDSQLLQKYQGELGKYQADVSKEVQQYQQNFQKKGTQYTWYQGQQAKLQQDYSQGIQMLIGGGMPQQQKGEK